MKVVKPKKYESIITLIFALIMFSATGFTLLEDIIFAVSKTETSSVIQKIYPSDSTHNRYQVNLTYFNKFKDKNIHASIFVDNERRSKLYSGKTEPIYYGIFFPGNVYFAESANTHFISYFVRILALFFIVIAGNKSVKDLKLR